MESPVEEDNPTSIVSMAAPLVPLKRHAEPTLEVSEAISPLKRCQILKPIPIPQNIDPNLDSAFSTSISSLTTTMPSTSATALLPNQPSSSRLSASPPPNKLPAAPSASTTETVPTVLPVKIVNPLYFILWLQSFSLSIYIIFQANLLWRGLGSFSDRISSCISESFDRQKTCDKGRNQRVECE